MRQTNPETLIHKYYTGQPELEQTLLVHSRQVADMALCICDAHPELQMDRTFLYEAAMLHDIGILETDAPGIHCRGTEPYIRHGIIGGEMLRREGLPRHAEVAERHTGTGLTVQQIERQQLPLPLRDFSPETLEEQAVCYADKFFSKSKLQERKTYERVLKSLERFGPEGLERFRRWYEIFAV